MFKLLILRQEFLFRGLLPISANVRQSLKTTCDVAKQEINECKGLVSRLAIEG